MKFIVGSGQSGAVSGPGMEGGDLSINQHVFIWKDDTREWIVADPSQPPFKPATVDGVLNNTIWQHCKAEQVATGEDIYLVLAGKGGEPISGWAEGGAQWAKLDSYVKHARASAETFNATVDTFDWYHGEADWNNNGYKADFLDLRDRMIASGWLTEETRVVWGEPNRSENQAKEAMLNMIGSGNYPWLHVADNYGVEYVNGGDGAHVTGNGAVQYGQAFYAAAHETGQPLNHWAGCDNFDFGTPGDDSISNGIDTTYMFGGDGIDRLNNWSDGSVMNGEDGDDVFILSGNSVGTRVLGGDGDDRLTVRLDAGDSYAFDYDTHWLTVNGENAARVWYTETINATWDR